MTTIFRCVQELLNNVAKHAQASNVWVVLGRNRTLVFLVVRDDGIGIGEDTTAPEARGSGILNLRERAAMTGGELSLAPGLDSGTVGKIHWRLVSEEVDA